MRRVAITGIGMVTGLGIGTDATWSNMLDGRSAVGPVRSFDASSLSSQLGAEVLGFEPEPFGLKARTLRMMTRADQYAFAAAKLAFRDAGWDEATTAGDRTALYAGGNKDICNPDHFEEALLVARRSDGSADVQEFGRVASDSVYPLFYIEGLPGSTLFFVSEAYGITGANAYFAGTAEAGLSALAAGARAIRRGEADRALAGGFDETVTWWNMTKLDALGILTDRTELGAAAFCPFDSARSGSVLGDGAVFMALEELDAAVARGANVYAEVTGCGAAFDNRALMSPDAAGREVSQAIGQALRAASTPVDEVDFIAAHGSATRLGDPSEVHGIRAALGAAAHAVSPTSVKPAIGHMVAAAGIANAAVAALAIRDGVAPPTLNLTNVDPECRLDWVTGGSRNVKIRTALALGRGIEGQAAAVAMRSLRRSAA